MTALAGLRHRFGGRPRKQPEPPLAVEDARTKFVFAELQKAICSLDELRNTFLPNVTVDHQSSRLRWEGFSRAEENWRWTEGKLGVISFTTRPSIPPAGVLMLDIDIFRRQSISIELNGKRIFSKIRLNGRNHLEMEVGNILPGDNRLTFHLPDAALAGNGDSRIVAMAFRTLRFEARF